MGRHYSYRSYLRYCRVVAAVPGPANDVGQTVCSRGDHPETLHVYPAAPPASPRLGATNSAHGVPQGVRGGRVRGGIKQPLTGATGGGLSLSALETALAPQQPTGQVVEVATKRLHPGYKLPGKHA